MASIRIVSSLTSGLLAKAGLVPPSPVREASTSLSASHGQMDALKKEDNGFWKESSIPAIYDETVQSKESKLGNKLEISRIVTADGVTSGDENCDSPGSSSKPKEVSVGAGKILPWHSLLLLLKPKLNIQSLRYSSSTCTHDDCGKVNNCAGDNDDCKPKPTSLDLPITCVKTKKPPQPCIVPTQRKWGSCDRSMCLPCCVPLDKPLKCKIFDITLNTCPRKTYRIASYSECSKRYGRMQKKKECCYHKRICYAGAIADREVKPLLHIKDRQALVLGFGVKAV